MLGRKRSRWPICFQFSRVHAAAYVFIGSSATATCVVVVAIRYVMNLRRLMNRSIRQSVR